MVGMIDCAVDQAFRKHEHLPQPLVDAGAFPGYSLYLRAHDRWRFPDLSVQVLVQDAGLLALEPSSRRVGAPTAKR